MKNVLLFTLILLLILIIGWHIIFPLMGGVIAFSVAAWGALIASVVAFCVAIMLLFVLTGVGIFTLGAVFFVWTLLAILLFPVIFPIIVPLLIIFFFISYFRRKQNLGDKK